MSTKETLRLQYTADRDADQAQQAQTESMTEYDMRFATWGADRRFKEAQRLYALGFRLGNMLFNSSIAQESEAPVDDNDTRVLNVPTLGSFLLRRDDSREAGRAYFLTTNTLTGLRAEDDYLAAIQPEFVDLSRSMGGKAVLARLAMSIDVFDDLRDEVGLPKVVSTLKLVK